MRHTIRSMLYGIVIGAMGSASVAVAVGMTRGDAPASPHNADATRGAEQMHAALLAQLSEQHRRDSAAVSALEQQRYALIQEINALADARDAEAQALAAIEKRRVDAKRRVARGANEPKGGKTPPRKQLAEHPAPR